MRRIVKPNQTPTAELDKFYGRKFNLTQFLFDKQLAFVEDPSPYKVAVCSRRAGKTVACAAHLIHTAINTPGIICLYITLSAANAKKLVWKELKKINASSRLNGKENDTEGSITFDNGSIVYISGAKDKNEIEKFRGLPIKLCYIDECQSFRSYIKDLIDEIIEPALLDYAGTLCLIGTPGPVPAGYFHECFISDNWSKHSWTYFDNPHIALKSGKTHQELLDRVLKRRGLTISAPTILREYFGKWTLDSEALVIKYDSNKNHYQDLLPNIKYNYIMGIDIGFKDADALCVLAWSENDPITYLVEESIMTKQGITELAEQIEALNAKYNVYKMIMDMGALGKKIGEEIIRRFKLPVEAAEKTRKLENIELLNDALRSSRFKAKSNSRFANDSYLMEFDTDKSTPERKVISTQFHSDIIDSVLYAFKLSPAYSYEAPAKKPKPGSVEWIKAQSNEMWEAELKGHQDALEYKKLYGED